MAKDGGFVPRSDQDLSWDPAEETYWERNRESGRGQTALGRHQPLNPDQDPRAFENGEY